MFSIRNRHQSPSRQPSRSAGASGTVGRPRRDTRPGRKVPLRLELLEDRNLWSVAGLPFNKVVLSFAPGLASAAQAVAAQSDGKLVVAGWTVSSYGNRDFGLVRLQPDGTLDPTFGTGGRTTVRFGGGDNEATGVVIQPDGKIVVAGFTQVNGTDYDFAVARLTATGALDPTFGNAGQATISFNLGGGNDDRATAVGLTYGTIVLGGYAQVGPTDYDFAVARLTANGILDPTFGGGKVTVPFNLDASGPNDDRANALTIYNNSVILAGYAQVSATDYDFALAGVLANGTLDPNFATGGKVAYSFNRGANNDDRATGITFSASPGVHGPGISSLIVSGTVQVSPTDFDFGYLTLDYNGKPPIYLSSSQTVIPINAIPGGVDRTYGSGNIQTNFSAYGSNSIPLFAGSAAVGKTGSSFAFTSGSMDTDLLSFSADNTSQDVARAMVVYHLTSRLSLSRVVLVGSTQPAGGVSSFAVALGNASTLSAQPAVVDPATSTWYLRGTLSAGSPDGGKFQYGLPGWTPVSGDWRGYGQAGIGVVDPATLTWYLRNETNGGTADAGSFQYGAPGWIPVVGDWNGDLEVSAGVFDPTTATWYLRNSNSAGAPDFTPFQFGAPGWIPVVGDWTGSGRTTVGVVDPATMTWYLRNSNGPGAPDIPPFQFGVPGWVPITGNWDGIGKTLIGVVDPNTETWYLNFAGFPGVSHFQYGAPGWNPVPAVYGISTTLYPSAAVGVAKAAQGTDRGDQVQQTLPAAPTLPADAGVARALLAGLASTTDPLSTLSPSPRAITEGGINRIPFRADAAVPNSVVDGKEDLRTLLLRQRGHRAEDASVEDLTTSTLAGSGGRMQALDAGLAGLA